MLESGKEGIQMVLMIDSERGRKVAELLYSSFSTTGIHGRNDMPEDLMPKGMIRGSLEHLLFITLTVSIDYQRDAPALWESARRTFEDPETRYLFEPTMLHEKSLHEIVRDMQRHGLSKKPNKDAYIWRAVGVSFHKKWDGDPRSFLQSCNWDALTILRRLKSDAHLENGHWRPDYPYLRGDKIGPLWLRMLRDNVGISHIRRLERVPIPVDIHVARATLTTGVVRGQFAGSLSELFGYVRRAWFESVRGLRVRDREMIALDVDEPLWHLSKYGCTRRDKITGYCPIYGRCDASEFCVRGMVRIENDRVELST